MVAQPDNRRRIGIRELRDHLSEVIREVHDEGVTVEVTIHGDTVAEVRPQADVPEQRWLTVRFGPTPPEVVEAERAWWAEQRRLAHLPPKPIDPDESRRRRERYDILTRELSKNSTGPFSAVELVREDRDAR